MKYIQEIQKVGSQKLLRKALWRSADDQYLVVSGPFPEHFFRSDTRSTWKAASKIARDSLYFHTYPTTLETDYAKVRAEDVDELGENEFGEICP